MQTPIAGPLFAWRDVALEYLVFLGAYALLGAAGFWVAVARPFLRGGGRDAPMDRAALGAARIALVGAVVSALMLLVGVGERAAENGIPLGDAARAGGPALALGALLLTFLVVGFALLAVGRARALWPAAVVGVFALTLRDVVQGRWQTIVNPLHLLAGGLWIGTLAVLAITVIPPALRRELGRGGSPSISQVIARFSRLSLFAIALLVASGLVTAWRQLKYPSALWTTPYGYVLLGKLAAVAIVVALGAFNWRRVPPSLGVEGGVARLRRSARAELLAAGVVLAITALLVSIPPPKLPASRAPAASVGASTTVTPPAAPR